METGGSEWLDSIVAPGKKDSIVAPGKKDSIVAPGKRVGNESQWRR